MEDAQRIFRCRTGFPHALEEVVCVGHYAGEPFFLAPKRRTCYGQRMELQLPETVASRIQKHMEANGGGSPLEVVERALDSLDSSGRVADRFAKYRGMATGWSVERMFKDRREGLR
jgi:hypothetical protein